MRYSMHGRPNMCELELINICPMRYSMDGKSQVYTYTNPQKWEKNPYFEKIKNGIHICASKNMVDGIKERYQKKDEFPIIFSMAEAIGALFPNFESSERKLERYLS
ncbi:MAG: hypothetical protein ACRCTS_01075, partial [Fusobacteriaceae bacterium]